jgi:hypothetical protein
MERRENWEDFLSDFICKRKDSAFKYGENDCCLFVADAVENITGVDIAEEFRGKYTSKVEAYRLLIKYSGGAVEETFKELSKNYGFHEISTKYAGRGDIALVRGEMGDAVGIVDMTGERVAIPARKGLIYFPMEEIIKSWRVG